MTRKNTIKKLSVGTASLLAATTVLGAATTTTVKAESNRADRARMEVLLKYVPYVFLITGTRKYLKMMHCEKKCNV
uniref:SA32 type M-like protein n=1 Tax=Streptococcus canis TaxID=1329 RepID=A0A1Z4F6B3_STRCB|nr:SA32 type M-like protein [Streptococcus canis]